MQDMTDPRIREAEATGGISSKKVQCPGCGRWVSVISINDQCYACDELQEENYDKKYWSDE